MEYIELTKAAVKMKMKMQRKTRNGRRTSEGAKGQTQEEEIVFEDKVICGERGRAILTTDSFKWKSTCVRLEDIIAVSCIMDSCQLLIHTYGPLRTRWVPALFGLARRRHQCLSFVVQNAERLAEWKGALAKQGCYAKTVPVFAETEVSTTDAVNLVSDTGRYLQQSKFLLVILNPCSGHGRARKIYYDKVEPIFKLAGLSCKVIETTGPHHAQDLASSFNFHPSPDGIVCIGGDGTVNEVLNGLLNGEDNKFGSIPIGVIPTGSDNSLIWTIFGIKDPVIAALAIIKGGLVTTDVLAVKWKKSDTVFLGHTTFYHGFMSEVLELSSKYQRFGPLRYFIAGAIQMLNLPQYECEIQYLPATQQAASCIGSDSAFSGLDHTILHGHEYEKEEHWESKKGIFLGIIICNHQCKTVQCLETQRLAPFAKHNDGMLDLLLVHKIGRFQLLLFLILMQYGGHISLPFVEYIKVQCARLIPVQDTVSCGIDGELLRIDSPASISIFPRQMYLIGHKVD